MKDNAVPITVEYQYKQDDKVLEEVFTYIFDEMEKIINFNQSDEQQISDDKAII